MSAMDSHGQSRFDDEGIREVKDLRLTTGSFSRHSDKKVSVSGDNPIQDMVSDSESGTSGTCSGENLPLFGSGFVRLHEEDTIYQVISQKFISTLAGFGMHTHIEAIHRNASTGVTGKAKFQCYMNFLRAMEEKTDGNANWRYAWYCGSKQEINTIISHGFGQTVNSGIYGQGIYFSPVGYPLQSLHSSTIDEQGLRHLLLCRVILGRREIIHPGSEQCHPSCEEFDSGVDNLLTPTKYIVWCTHMNTHVFPEFVISIRAPPLAEGRQRFSTPLKKPSSPWMPFPTLISTLSQYLTPDSIKLIRRLHTDHRVRKITREELIRRVRQIAGDELLFGVIKSFKEKLNSSKGSKPNRSSTKCHQQHAGDCACSKNEGFKFC